MLFLGETNIPHQTGKRTSSSKVPLGGDMLVPRRAASFYQSPQQRHCWLMVSTRLKNMSQIGSSPQVGVKQKTCLKPPPSINYLNNDIIIESFFPPCAAWRWAALGHDLGAGHRRHHAACGSGVQKVEQHHWHHSNGDIISYFYIISRYMDVSKNRGIPKWMVYHGKPY